MYVRLDQEWTDSDGTRHPAGAVVDVDAATLAQLQAERIVSEQVEPEGGGWVGPTDGSEGGGPVDVGYDPGAGRPPKAVKRPRKTAKPPGPDFDDDHR